MMIMMMMIRMSLNLVVIFLFSQHKEMMCILPSTVKIADLFIAPNTFLATHVYTPASVRQVCGQSSSYQIETTSRLVLDFR